MPDAPTTPAGRDPFVIVPTIDGYAALDARVADLEARVPADGPLGTLATTSTTPDPNGARLDRHRQELDELKLRYNQLVQYLEHQLPAAAAPTPGGFL
jgi:hypothetical protein